MQQTTEPVAEYAEVLLESSQPPSLEWRRVSIMGAYLTDKAVTVINRSSNGTAGYNPVVPFQMNSGEVILVNRGFVPLTITAPTAPRATLEIVGYLRLSQSRGTFGAVDNTDSNNTEFQRFDVPLIMKTIGKPALPYFLQLIKESPSPNTEWPQPVTLPEQSEGSHLSYAVQWFFFSAVAIAAWVVVIRRRLRGTSNDPVVPSGTSA